MADVARREVTEELPQLVLGGIVTGALRARVQNDEAAVLEVVDPALGLAPVVGPVCVGLKRTEACLVDVGTRCRRAVRVANVGARRDMGAAHVGLGLTETRRFTRRWRGRRCGGDDR